jgi:hypothetical protein
MTELTKKLNFDNSIPKDWTENVTESISLFIKLIDEVDEASYGKNDIKNLEKTVDFIRYMTRLTKKMDFDNSIPKDWAENVTESISSFIKLIDEVDEASYGKNDIKNLERTVSFIKYMTQLTKKMNFDNSIPKNWTENVIESISSFIKLIDEVDESSYGKNDIKNLERIINVIKYMSESIKEMKYNLIPKDWTENITESISSFIKLIDDVDEASYGKNDIKNLIRTIDIIKTISDSLSDIKYNSIPKDWTENVTESISLFVKLIDGVDESSYGKNDIKNLERTVDIIKYISNSLTGIKYNSIPLQDNWINSIKDIINLISIVPDNLHIKSDILSETFNKLSQLNKNSDELTEFANSIRDVSKALENVNLDVIDKLTKFTGGLLVLSLVDESNLERTLNKINDKKGELTEVLTTNDFTKQYGNEVTPIVKSQTILKSDKDELKKEKERFEKMFKHLESIDLHISEMLENNHLDSPSNLTYSGWGKSKDNFD